MTSASTPSAASRSAASSASPTRRDSATIVMSLPLRSVRAWPIGAGSGRIGDGLPAEVQRLVLDEHDRIRIGDGGLQKSGGVGGAARHHDLQPGHVRQPRLEALGVLGAVALPGAALSAEHERHRQLPARHEVRLGRLVDQLVERERDEVDEHDLDDGFETRLGRTDRHAADGALADRRVADALAAELLGEPSGDQVRAALGDVLAEHDHSLVLAHRTRERPVDRLDERGLDLLGHSA